LEGEPGEHEVLECGKMGTVSPVDSDLHEGQLSR
jgi:ribonuclease HII